MSLDYSNRIQTDRVNKLYTYALALSLPIVFAVFAYAKLRI